ncbi:MAG: serine hydrolase domain-containing protein, partial [Acidimicrobiales bacterium]
MIGTAFERTTLERIALERIALELTAGQRRRLWWRSALIALGSAVFMLASSCSPPESAGGDADRPTFSADVGCHPSMDSSFQAWADRGVGASIVDVGGERECFAAYGFADPESGRPNTTDTVYAIGSITKAVTAAAIFDLIDDGVLTLDDTAGQHVPGLTGPAAEATLRELLLHTSGVTGEHGFDHVPLTKSDAIVSISELDRAAEAGTAYLYMNANYTVLALVIDEVTTEGYRQYVVDEIMHDGTGRPLGGWWDGDPAPAGPRAWGFFADEAAQQRGDAPGPHWAMEGNGLMAMTPLEMAEWIYALFNEQILTPEATEHLLSTSTLLAGDKELPAWAEIGPNRFGERIFATAGGGTGIGHEMNVAWMPESGRVVVIAENALDY